MSGNDETASLMNAFARVQTSLREMVLQINGGFAQLSSAAVELATSAEHVSGWLTTSAPVCEERLASAEMSSVSCARSDSWAMLTVAYSTEERLQWPLALCCSEERREP